MASPSACCRKQCMVNVLRPQAACCSSAQCLRVARSCASLRFCLPAGLNLPSLGTGRSWIEPPKDLKSRREAEQCFLPKRHIHTWSGHSKGVNAIRWVGQAAAWASAF